MSTITGGQFVEQAKRQMLALEQQQRDAQRAQADHQKKVEELKSSLQKALDEMASYLLPRLSRESFEAVKNSTGYGQFLVVDPIARMEQERPRLAAKISQIEANDIFKRGELILMQIKESEEQFQVLSQALLPYENEPRLITLFERGYKTPDYPFRWWNATYYSDWKWGDIYEERFGKPIADLKKEFESLKRDQGTLRESLKEGQEKRRQAEELKAEHERLTNRLQNLEKATLEECQQRLKEHLQYADKEHLLELSKGDKTKEAFVKRLRGIEKQTSSLQQLGDRYFTDVNRALNDAISKLQQKIEKYQRPKNYYARIPQQEAQRMFPNMSRFNERQARYQQQSTVIVEVDYYHHYDHLLHDALHHHHHSIFDTHHHDVHHHDTHSDVHHSDTSSGFFDAGSSLERSSSDTSSSASDPS